MTRGRLAVHAHFYQPERRDPFGGPDRPDPTAAPYASWTARIDAECYRPNAERGNFARISFNVGPTLAISLAAEDPETMARVVAAGRSDNAFAQGFHHTISRSPPRATAGRRSLGAPRPRGALRRRAVGFWLPE